MSSREATKRLRQIRKELGKAGFAFKGGKFVFDNSLDLSRYMRTKGAIEPKRSKRKPYSF